MGVAGQGTDLERLEMVWRQSPDHVGSTVRAKVSARKMRRDMTDAERRLWAHLRYRLPLASGHFRRQFAVGPYIADFVHLGSRLIVEVDGEQHGFDAQRRHDIERDRYLVQQNFRVLRFSNRDVLTGIDGVLEAFASALATATRTPTPSPQGGGEPINPNG